MTAPASDHVYDVVVSDHVYDVVVVGAGAAGVGVGSAVNRLSDELAMVAVVHGLRAALLQAVPSRL